ncbi:MAG: hypothetical protein HY966_02100 [Ignavibacteriales bacterium]|nr:hypothetical protein [Ignavibacteriales bacterium]
MTSNCEVHSGQIAATACVVCAKPLCAECVVQDGTNAYCSEDHRSVGTSYALLASVATWAEAEALKANLRQANIDATWYCRADNVSSYGMEDAESTMLFVPRPDVARANNVLSALNLLPSNEGML